MMRDVKLWLAKKGINIAILNWDDVVALVCEELEKKEPANGDKPKKPAFEQFENMGLDVRTKILLILEKLKQAPAPKKNLHSCLVNERQVSEKNQKKTKQILDKMIQHGYVERLQKPKPGPRQEWGDYRILKQGEELWAEKKDTLKK